MTERCFIWPKMRDTFNEEHVFPVEIGDQRDENNAQESSNDSWAFNIV